MRITHRKSELVGASLIFLPPPSIIRTRNALAGHSSHSQPTLARGWLPYTLGKKSVYLHKSLEKKFRFDGFNGSDSV